MFLAILCIYMASYIQICIVYIHQWSTRQYKMHEEYVTASIAWECEPLKLWLIFTRSDDNNTFGKPYYIYNYYYCTTVTGEARGCATVRLIKSYEADGTHWQNSSNHFAIDTDVPGPLNCKLMRTRTTTCTISRRRASDNGTTLLCVSANVFVRRRHCPPCTRGEGARRRADSASHATKSGKSFFC